MNNDIKCLEVYINLDVGIVRDTMQCGSLCPRVELSGKYYRGVGDCRG
jgi:hypothetical protein